MAPTLQVGLEAKLDKLQEGFDQAVKMSEEAVQKIEESFSNANPKLSGFLGGLTGGLIGAGAAEGLGRVLDAIKNIVHELANLETVARRVGLTLDELQAFRFAASTSGVSEGDFASGLNQMASPLTRPSPLADAGFELMSVIASNIAISGSIFAVPPSIGRRIRVPKWHNINMFDQAGCRGLRNGHLRNKAMIRKARRPLCPPD